MLPAIIENLLNNPDFGMVPHMPNPDTNIKLIYSVFENLSIDIIYKALLTEIHHNNFQNALQLTQHFKGKLSFFDDTLTFYEYKKIKNYVTSEINAKYIEKFYKEYGDDILYNQSKIIDFDILDIILDKDINLYMQIAKKKNIIDAGTKIFQKNKNVIFSWINTSDDKYRELIKLNQPMYIIQHMNGQLDVCEQSVKYIVELFGPDISFLIQLKKQIGLEKLWSQSKHKLSNEFYFELVETLDELIFVINIDNMRLETIESCLNKLNSKFPTIYANFTSLMFLKKDFINK